MSESYRDDMTGPEADIATGGPGRTALDGDAPGASEEHPDHDLSYEQAREALGHVVQSLEAGGITLAESIALWERGERLANVCQRLLDGAQERLDAAIERAQQDDAGY